MKRWTILLGPTAPNTAGEVTVRARDGARICNLTLPTACAYDELTDDDFDRSFAHALTLHNAKLGRR